MTDRMTALLAEARALASAIAIDSPLNASINATLLALADAAQEAAENNERAVCVWCGFIAPLATDDKDGPMGPLAEHVLECVKHPVAGITAEWAKDQELFKSALASANALIKELEYQLEAADEGLTKGQAEIAQLRRQLREADDAAAGKRGGVCWKCGYGAHDGPCSTAASCTDCE